MISVIIPNRDRGGQRLKEVIQRLDDELVKEIIIVDYGSNKPLKVGKDTPKWDNIKIIRYNKTKEWNKAHAINIGVKRAKADYIMTLDSDILVGPEFFYHVYYHLDENTFIYSNYVKRIQKEDLSDYWDDCIQKSVPWTQNRDKLSEMYHLATGGYQIFPKDWFYDIRGLDENLVYYGGMDNVTIVDAKRNNLDLVVLNEPILHLEHPKQKEDNIDEKERELAKYIHSKRRELLNRILSEGYDKNPKFWGSLTKPNDKLFKQDKQEFFKNYKEEEEVEGFEFPTNLKIMIAVINNRESLPERFVQSLIELQNYTSAVFPNTSIHYVKACQVNHMRNLAVQKAIETEQDYLVQLDCDHTYPKEFIIKLLGRNLEFITGCTKQRTYPYNPTQYYKFKTPLKTRDNMLFSKGESKINKIEVSGPVGMLMKVSALKQLDFPYYYMDYSYFIEGQPNPLGGDYVFTRQLKEKGFDLYVDESVEFPHFIEGNVSAFGDEAKVDLK